MLEAKKNIFFEKVFSFYNHHLLKRRFHSLQISGLEFLGNKDPNVPLLIYANHSSWWDGLVFLEILRKFRFENYVMMEEKQLRKLFFFRWLGAFSVVREKPREAVKSVNYTSQLMIDNPNRTILIFPQGKILPNDVRPIHFYNGLTKIIQKVENCAVLPAALRFEFLGNFKPEIFVKISAPETFSIEELRFGKKLTENFEEKITRLLDALKSDITSQKTEDYEKIF